MPDGPKYILRVLEGPNNGQIYELGTKPVTLGRHHSNTIHIVDEAVSSYHAEIVKEPIGYVVTDLGSTNGTRVKVKQKPDFEKVVKTPLSVGVQIRVGKTTLEFLNIGKPVEDEALFGTVALEPDKLEAKLSEPSREVPMPILVALAALVFLGVLAAVVYGVPAATAYFGTHPPIPDDKKAPIIDPDNKILNGDFSQGTDDVGNPKEFRLERGAPGVKAEVTADADHGKGEPKLGLRINKAGKSASALTAVETANSFPLEPGKVYEFSGWMRNDGDGLFGLRVTWIQGERKLSENVVVLKDTQEWKEKTAPPLTPPPWAQRAKAGVFVQGKDGKACFDDLVFREKQGASPSPAPSIKFGSVGIAFEGTKGMFTGTLQGDKVLEDGTLVLVSRDGSAVSDLASAIEPQLKSETNTARFEGSLYDFALQELTNYLIQARQAGQGVELKVAADSPQEAASAPQVRFYVAGSVAQGDVEASKPGGGGVERISATEGNKALNGIEELLFNAGKTLQLDLMFSKPADVELKREGKRCGVTISFKGEMQISLAPESVGQKRLMLAALGEMKKSFEASRFGEAEVKLRAFREAHAARFQQARDEATKLEGQLDTEWRKSWEEVQNAVKMVEKTPSPEAGELAKKTTSRCKEKWAGSEKQSKTADAEQQIDNLVKAGNEAIAEKEAEALYRKAENYYSGKAFKVASLILIKIIKDFPNAKVTAKAKELLPQYEAAERRVEEINAIQDRLRAKSKNYLLTNDYKNAINVIEKDKEYQDNRTDLKDINALLDEWRKKGTQ